MRKHIVGLVVGSLWLTLGAHGNTAAGEDAAGEASATSAASVSSRAGAVREARLVMDAFMAAFNARDAARWADTLLFPHVRIAGGGVTVTHDKAAFVAGMDFAAFAESQGWARSAWRRIDVVQAGADKVHFSVTFARYNASGEAYAVFDSLYVVQKVEGRWGIRARSSFAP